MEPALLAFQTPKEAAAVAAAGGGGDGSTVPEMFLPGGLSAHAAYELCQQYQVGGVEFCSGQGCGGGCNLAGLRQHAFLQNSL